MTPQELKNSILQLAIQGKLVEQRPEEGTGGDLLVSPCCPVPPAACRAEAHRRQAGRTPAVVRAAEVIGGRGATPSRPKMRQGATALRPEIGSLLEGGGVIPRFPRR